MKHHLFYGGGVGVGRGEQCTPPFYGLVHPGCAHGAQAMQSKTA